MARAGWGIGLCVLACLPSHSGLANDKIDLKLGGYSKWWMVGAWNDAAYQNAAGVDLNSLDVKGDNEIHFKGSTTLDQGVQIGIKVELEAGGHTDQRTDTIDKSYVWLQSGWGKLQLGTDYNAASLLHVAAPDAAGLSNGPPNGVMSDYVIARPSAVSTMYSGNQTELDRDDNADKISYFTPQWNGLTLGVTYVPSAVSEDNRGATQSSSVYAVGLGYETKISEVGLALSAGWMSGDVENSPGSAQSTFRAVSIGGQLSYGGVTVAASYGNERNNFSNGVFAANATDDSGQSWDVGIQYDDGPLSVSATHYQSWVKGLVADDGRDHISVYQMSGKYSLGPGVALLGSLAHIRYQDEGGKDIAANNNSGYALMTGLGLWF